MTRMVQTLALNHDGVSPRAKVVVSLARDQVLSPTEADPNYHQECGMHPQETLQEMKGQVLRPFECKIT